MITLGWGFIIPPLNYVVLRKIYR